MGVSQSTPMDEDEVEVYDDPAEPARRVRYMLSELGLPAELVLEIMDLADYHPTVSIECEHLVKMRADAHARGDPCSSRLYFISPPLPGAEEGENWRMRRATWYIEGRDQGWGGEQPGLNVGAGTFNGAHSWYEACIFRPEPNRHSLETEKLKNDDLDSFKNTFYSYRTTPDMVSVLEQHRVGWSLVRRDDGDVVWHVQSNKVAEREYGAYTVEWREGEPADVERAKENGQGDGRGFVEALRPRDRVGLLMRAQYPGWENTLRHASVELMYEVR